jgi:hypothetical protein
MDDDSIKEQATEEEIQRAREKYALGSDDNIEIDSNALVSRGDDGCFVQAWVWLEDENRNRDWEMHDDHIADVNRFYSKKGKRYKLVAHELVDGVSYILTYQWAWPATLRFHYETEDFAFVFDSISEVGEPYQPWFFQKMLDYKPDDDSEDESKG